jgi:hypothetical protein
VQIQQPSPVTHNVFSELEFIRMMSEGRTGVNSMATSGTPRPSNANRTLGGVQEQSRASAGRLQTLVKNTEDYGIVPILAKSAHMSRIHTAPWQRLPAKRGEEVGTVEASALAKKVKFRMLASSKMMTRDKLAQTFPYVFQFLVNGPVMGQLAQAGQTLDFNELVRMLSDATGLGQQYNFIRQLTDEEKKAQQQPSPELQAETAKQDKELQVRMQLGELKSQTDIQKAMIAKSPDQQAQIQAQQQAQIEQIKLHMAARMEDIKQQAQRDKNAQERQQKQQELILKQQGADVDRRGAALKHVQGLDTRRANYSI